MFMMKLKAASAVLLVAGTVASGAGYLTHFAAADDPKAAQASGEKPANQKPAKPKSDLEELQGTWATRFEHAYTINNEPRVDIVNEKWVISGSTVRTFPKPTERQASMLDERTYLIKLDPGKPPKTIDLNMPGLGSLIGIYDLEGDSLRICFSFGKRPTAFAPDPKTDTTLLTFKRLRRIPEEIAPRFAIDPGCYWVTYPSQPGGAHANNSFAMMMEYESGVLRIHLACPATNLDEGQKYRPVAFDADRKRYYPRQAGGAGSGMRGGKIGAALHQYRLDKDDLKGKSIKYVGVELVPPVVLEGEKAKAAEKPKH